MGQNGTKLRENYKNTEKHGWELCNNYIIVRNLDECKNKKEHISQKKISHQMIKMKLSKCKFENTSSFLEKTKKKYLRRKPKSKVILFEVNPEDISKYLCISKTDITSSSTTHKNQKRKPSIKHKLKKQNNFCCDIKSVKPLNYISSSSEQLPSEFSSNMSTIKKYLMENSSCSEYSMSFSTAHETTVTNEALHTTDQTSVSWPSLKKYCDMALANLFDCSKSKSVDDKLVKPKLDLRSNNKVQIIMNVKNFSSSDTLLKMQTKNNETSDQRQKLLQQLSKESENTLNRLLELKKKYSLKSKSPKGLKFNLNQSCQTLEVAICLNPQKTIKKPLKLEVIPKIVDIEPKIEEVSKTQESVVNTLSVTTFSGASLDATSFTTDFSKILCDTESKELLIQSYADSQKEDSSTNVCSSKTTITDDHIWSSLNMETFVTKPTNKKRITKIKIANSDKVLNVPAMKQIHHVNPLQFESETIFSKIIERKKVKRMSLLRKLSQNLVELHTKKDYFALEANSSCCDKTSEDFSESKKFKHSNFEKKSENSLDVIKKQGGGHKQNNSTTLIIVNKFEEVLNKMLLLISNKKETEVVEKSTLAVSTFHPSKHVTSNRYSFENLTSSQNITNGPSKSSLNNLKSLPRECRVVNQWDSVATNYSNASLDANASSIYSVSDWYNKSQSDFEIPYKGWDSPSCNQNLQRNSGISEISKYSESSRGTSMLLPDPIAAKECLSEFMRTFDNALNVKKKNSNQCFSCSFQTVAFVAILYLTLLQFILTITVNYFSPFGK